MTAPLRIPETATAAPPGSAAAPVAAKAADPTAAAPADFGPAAAAAEAGTVPAAARSWRERAWCRWAWDAGRAAAIGAVAGALMSLNDRLPDLLVSMAVSAAIGVAIVAAARLLFRLLERPVGRLRGAAALAARIGLFAASGMVALAVVEALSALLFGLHFGRHAWTYASISVGMAVTCGLAFTAFDAIRSRLEASVARLKEVEFAEKELRLARELQARLLPPAAIEGEGYRIAARNLAARAVAGDFYDSFPLPGGAVGVAVGDVAGKGMAAALIMASVKAMLPLIAAERSAADTLRQLNRRLAAELPGREFVALAFARFEPDGGRLEIANAGLPDPYLLGAVDRGGPAALPSPLVVPGPRLPLGVRREVEYRALEVRLAPGDRLLLFSDGLPEAPGPGGEPLGYDALADLLADGGEDGGQGEGRVEGQGHGQGGEDEPPLAWLDRLMARVRGATQPVLEDDWTALVLERLPPAGAANAQSLPRASGGNSLPS